MKFDPDQDAPAALAAIELRRRLRSLAVGQTEAFDVLQQRFAARSLFAASIARGAGRLPLIATLLADVAWTNGDKSGHDGRVPSPAPEAEAVRRVCSTPVSPRRQPSMAPEQRDAIVAYLDALLAVIGDCCKLDLHAPSATLGVEARRFVADFTKVREATLLG